MLCNFFCFCSKPAEAQEAEAEAAASGIGEMGKNLADKAQATFEVIRNSDIVSNSQ